MTAGERVTVYWRDQGSGKSFARTYDEWFDAAHLLNDIERSENLVLSSVAAPLEFHTYRDALKRVRRPDADA